MVEPRRDRVEWVDMGAVLRLADRVARTTTAPAEAYWREPARPVLGRHWALADHDWHRRREWGADAATPREETDHQFTRYALLPDGRLVRALCWRSEVSRPDVDDGAVRAEPWQGEVRPVAARDVRVLDRATVSAVERRGTVTTWGTRPTGEDSVPWPGAGVERLLTALLVDRPGRMGA